MGMRALTPLDWEVFTGRRVRVFRNLQRKMMSVQVQPAGRKTWEFAGHCSNLVLANVTFPVNERRRQYICEVRKKRDVCAWAEGDLVGEFSGELTADIPIAFNPFLHEYFFQKGTDLPILPCRTLVVRDNQAFASFDALGQLEGGCTDCNYLQLTRKPDNQLVGLPENQETRKPAKVCHGISGQSGQAAHGG